MIALVLLFKNIKKGDDNKNKAVHVDPLSRSQTRQVLLGVCQHSQKSITSDHSHSVSNIESVCCHHYSNCNCKDPNEIEAV